MPHWPSVFEHLCKLPNAQELWKKQLGFNIRCTNFLWHVQPLKKWMISLKGWLFHASIRTSNLGWRKKIKKAPQIEKWGKNTQVCGKMAWRKLITARIVINKTLHDPFCQWGISGGDRQVRVLMNSLFLNSLPWAQHKPLHKSGSLWTVGIIYIKCASQQNMAKFLFPTGRKSYFMAVIPLSRIQRLAVGNRGGREAYQQKEGGFLPASGWSPAESLLKLGVMLSVMWQTGVRERDSGENFPWWALHIGKNHGNFVGVNSAGSIETIFKGCNLLMEDRITVKTTRLHPTVIAKRLNHQIKPWPDLGDQGCLGLNTAQERGLHNVGKHGVGRSKYCCLHSHLH